MPKKIDQEVEGRFTRAPKGHFVVYVGSDELKRFVVPMSFLKVPIFQQLLHKSAEEFGFYNNNRIILPCDESTFRDLTKLLSKRA